ncbi:MAG: hypothetical protein DDG60_16360 [Anaerolineae bacterium]|nr:MAG: hypothetical protein DDG60_16360 [Anaerolineae bacterium]
MDIVVLISAHAEWRAIQPLFPDTRMASSPFGEYFHAPFDTHPSARLTFFYGGWGKISAAATTQYVIDHFHPKLLVNLGTCGGFAGHIQVGDILLVEKTIVYDILEQMGDAAAAIADYTTVLDLSWLSQPFPPGVQRGLLVSADRDIIPADVPWLVQRFGARAADWESGAIAWVAHKNRIPCLILRAVTDLVDSRGGEAYGNVDLFQQRTTAAMHRLWELFRHWLAALE